jgi:hypothetical protein
MKSSSVLHFDTQAQSNVGQLWSLSAAATEGYGTQQGSPLKYDGAKHGWPKAEAEYPTKYFGAAAVPCGSSNATCIYAPPYDGRLWHVLKVNTSSDTSVSSESERFLPSTGAVLTLLPLTQRHATAPMNASSPWTVIERAEFSSSGTNFFKDATAAPCGMGARLCVFACPYDADAVLKIDPADDVVTLFGWGQVGTGRRKYSYAIAAPCKSTRTCVFCLPSDAEGGGRVLRIDPVDETVTLLNVSSDDGANVAAPALLDTPGGTLEIVAASITDDDTILTVDDKPCISEASELAKLSGCTSLDALCVFNCTDCVDLAPLGNVLQIASSITIGANPKLASVSALSRVEATGGAVVVVGNTALQDLAGFNFTTIGRRFFPDDVSLRIEDNAVLSDVSALGALDGSVPGSLLIRGCPFVGTLGGAFANVPLWSGGVLVELIVGGTPRAACTNLTCLAVLAGTCAPGYAYIGGDDGLLCIPCHSKGMRCCDGPLDAECTDCRFESAQCFGCPAGRHSVPGGRRCLPCANGQFSAAESLFCSPECNLGDESNAIGRTCLPCEKGHFGTQFINDSVRGNECTLHAQVCEICPQGKWQSERGEVYCFACPADKLLTDPALGAVSIENCIAGRSNSTYTCQGGTFCPELSCAEASACEDCLPGHFSDVGSLSCQPCADGKFSNARAVKAACTDCPAGKHSSPGRGCLPCDAGRFSAAGRPSCDPCGGANVYCPAESSRPQKVPALFFSTGPNATHRTSIEQCPRIGVSCAAGVATVKPGFWKEPGTTITESSGANVHRCLGQDTCANATCKDGHTGLICGECALGYSKVAGVCAKCPTAKSGTGPALIVLAFALAALAVSLVVTRQALAPDFDSARLTVMRIFVTYTMQTGALAQMRLDWGASLQSLFDINAAASGGTPPFMGCIGVSESTTITATLCVPFLVPLFPLGCIGVWRAYHGLKGDRAQTIWGVAPALFAHVSMLALAFLFWPSVVQASLQALHCVPLGRLGSFWVSDLSVSCSSESAQYGTTRAFGLVTLLCIVPLLPGGLYVLLRRNRKLLGDRAFCTKYLFLYGGFKTEFCWWECVVMTRKVALLATGVFLADNPTFQLFVATCVLLAAFIAQTVCRPYAHPTESQLETLSLGATLITLLFGQAIVLSGLVEEKGVPGLGPTGESALRVAAGALNLSTFLTFAAFMVKELRSSPADAKEQVQDAVEVVEETLPRTFSIDNPLVDAAVIRTADEQARQHQDQAL